MLDALILTLTFGFGCIVGFLAFHLSKDIR